MELSLKQIGARIRTAREAQNITQFQLAEMINISLSHMSNIETGNTNFGVDILVRLAQALQVSTDALLRPDVPQVTALYAEEIDDLLRGRSPEEMQLLTKILRDVTALLERKTTDGQG